jgi:catechol 2,3-dioxygenase-like lactoylglutathione lyase family enzyme
MPPHVRYVHTNLIAHDWRQLSAFYQTVLGCTPVGPERDLCGPWIDAATGLAGARIRGIHLRLPGCGEDGPSLEIFTYEPGAGTSLPPRHAINQPGLGHLAFAVNDIAAAREAILAAGGGDVGQVVTLPVAGAGTVTFVYLTDPEGNIIELQRWQQDGG